MEAVIQEEITGCGIAVSAALVGISYEQARKTASALGIHAQDIALWSDTAHVRRLLRELGVAVSAGETPFESWEHLPDRALLAIKWRMENGTPFWHWVLFVREGGQVMVLDPRKGLKSNIRRDFGRMKPQWFIEVVR